MSLARLRFLQTIFFLLALGIVARLFFWQILHYDQFAAAAALQHVTTVSIGADRGKVLANDGEILVSNQATYLMYDSLNEIKKLAKDGKNYDQVVKETVEKISPFLLSEKIALQKEPDKLTETDKAKFEDEIKDQLTKALTTQDVVWVALARKVSEADKASLEKLQIAGLGFEVTSSRFYPNQTLGSQLLGFVGFDSEGNDKGYSGLEGFYDEQLAGRSGNLTQEVDAQGHPILAGLTAGAGPVDGFDLKTSIDRTVQFTVEKYLQEGVKKYGAKSASAIVMDPKTGAILAIANVPNFDPNKWAAYDPKELNDSAISDVYEPGSTFKIITASAGLDSGSITTDTACPCTGPIEVGGFKVETWNNQYHPNSTVEQILENSDNVGASFIEGKIGNKKFLDYVDKFGFGAQTGVDLQGEATGLLKDIRDWYPIDYVTASFGQGLSVTALQILDAASAIANGGKLMKPFVVQKIVGTDQTIENKPTLIRQVIKPETAATMRNLMLDAVENGEARRIIPHNLRIAGKTGTAQIPIAGHYDPSKTVASFVGFGPVEDPRFAMIVRYDEPFPQHGSLTAEPTFFQIAQDLYAYFGIPFKNP